MQIDHEETRRFKITPMRQELNDVTWRLLAWSYGCIAVAIVAGTVGTLGVESRGGRLVLIVLASIFGLLGALAFAAVAAEYLAKILTAVQMKKKHAFIACERGVVQFALDSHRNVSVPTRNVSQVQVCKARGDVVAPDCGLGIVLEKLGEIHAEDQIIEEMEKIYKSRQCCSIRKPHIPRG